GKALADGDGRRAQGAGSQADGIADAHRRDVVAVQAEQVRDPTPYHDQDERQDGCRRQPGRLPAHGCRGDGDRDRGDHAGGEYLSGGDHVPPPSAWSRTPCTRSASAATAQGKAGSTPSERKAIGNASANPATTSTTNTHRARRLVVRGSQPPSTRNS